MEILLGIIIILLGLIYWKLHVAFKVIEPLAEPKVPLLQSIKQAIIPPKAFIIKPKTRLERIRDQKVEENELLGVDTDLKDLLQ